MLTEENIRIIGVEALKKDAERLGYIVLEQDKAANLYWNIKMLGLSGMGESALVLNEAD